MRNETQDLRVSARTARLTAADGTDDAPPWRFSGIAVAAGDILHMDDGTRVLMTAEELRKAAESQADEPLTMDHPEDDRGRPQYPPPVEETIGRVPKAGWLEEPEAVGYEATTHNEGIAEGVRAGTYDVSVHPRFQLGEFRDDVQAYVAEDIQFLDLSVVAKGDSPSNTAEWGPSESLAAAASAVDFGDAFGGSGALSDELTGAEGDSKTMDTETRQQYIRFVATNTNFDENQLASMSDTALDQTYKLTVRNGVGGDGESIAESDAAILDALVGELEEKMLTEDDLIELMNETDADGDGSGTDPEELEAYSTGAEGFEEQYGNFTAEGTASVAELTSTDSDDPGEYGSGMMHDVRSGIQLSASKEDMDLVGAENEEEYREIMAERLSPSHEDDTDEHTTGMNGQNVSVKRRPGTARGE